MTIVELYKKANISGATFQAPFVAMFKPARTVAASYWTSTFGAPDESQLASSFIDQVVVGGSDNYDSVASLVDCIAQQRSFYWDNTNQTLYVHFPSTVYPIDDSVAKGAGFGYSDEDVTYVDGVEYLPLISELPSMTQQQDLLNYGKPAFMNGSFRLNNADGSLDAVVATLIFGARIRRYFLDSSRRKLSYNRSEMKLQASMYIENYTLNQKQLTVAAQDLRKLYNQPVPSAAYSKDDYADLDDSDVGRLISLVYGPVRGLDCLCTNKATTSGDVNYRCALLLTVIGDVYVVDGDTERLVTTSSVSLATGEFVLAEADARNADGTPLEAFVKTATGIANSHATDVIVDLNERFAGIAFTSSNYDLTEWASEGDQLGPIGVVFDEQAPLWTQIQKVQNGASLGFLYTLLGDGRRTVRTDDWSRVEKQRVGKEHILNIDDMPLETDTTNISATVVARYNHDRHHDSWSYEENTDNFDHVRSTYGQTPLVQIDTLCTTAGDAARRASQLASHQRDAYSTVSLMLFGDSDLMVLRIYDVLVAELTTGFVQADDDSIEGREYLGIQRVQVISVAPDSRAGTNRITAVLYIDQSFIRITEDGRVRVTTDGSIRRT